MDWGNKKERSEKSMRLERIDRLLSIIDYCLAHPFIQDSASGEYQYKKAIRIMYLVSNATSPDFDTKEKNKDNEYRNKIRDCQKDKPIFVIRHEPSLVGKTILSRKFVNANWEELEQILTEYYQFLLNSIAIANKGFSYTDEDTSGTVIEGDDDNA